MKNSPASANECPVYPGEYIPFSEKKALLEELIKAHKDSLIKPPLNLDEFKDYYKIEIMMPGAKREDIFIYVHDDFLYITVLHKMNERLETNKLRIHEYDIECLERHILLPEDTEFISAEYRQGILQLYLPKTEELSKITSKQIVVY